uniref:PA polymerase n=1 Tax=Culex modestus orthomyxo-like virus TaxID=2805754 RepID=A0A889INP0_9ORTO|nr:MAG: PA polymerase [Culex modestus orthomyxo-like virus]
MYLAERRNPFDKLINESGIYPREVVLKWGIESEYWPNETWQQREHSLRHDFVCILLCNLEQLDMTEHVDRATGQNKRMRVAHEEEAASSSSGRVASGGAESVIEAGFDVASGCQPSEDRFRYILLEGMPRVNSIITALCKLHKIPVPSHVFDIFDRALRQWIEVKVTLDVDEAFETYRAVTEHGVNSCFIHFNPTDARVEIRGRVEKMPGEAKATEFLLLRKQELAILTDNAEPDSYVEDGILESTLRCVRFNADCDKWVESWWKERLRPELKIPSEFPQAMVHKSFSYLEFANYIEDTTKRTGEVMKFSAKVLPSMMVHMEETHCDGDESMVSEFLSEIEVEAQGSWGSLLREVKGAWLAKGERSHFNVVGKKECMTEWPALSDCLGIGRKTTVRNDNNPDLRQEDFIGAPRARYSPWMSQLLYELSKQHSNGVKYFRDLALIEQLSINPHGAQAQQIRSFYFKVFGLTRAAEYCSQLRNFYSRLGGAYFERCEKGNHGKVMYFPLYSVGSDPGDDNIKRRFVSGICVRGPHHAKDATDRISFITVERAANGDMGKEWAGIVKNARLIHGKNGRLYILRQNSICKQDPSFLSFVHNSTYLTANFVGEIVMNSIEVQTSRSSWETAQELLLSKGPWLMERVAESIMMAVLGRSQEEGAMAAVRKIYMTALAKWRGDDPWCRDWEGLAESLNECLMDSPLALYWAKQTRDLLIALDSQ